MNVKKFLTLFLTFIFLYPIWKIRPSSPLVFCFYNQGLLFSYFHAIIDYFQLNYFSKKREDRKTHEAMIFAIRGLALHLQITETNKNKKQIKK